MVDKEKMSKSLGNFFTIRDVLNHYNAEAGKRYFLLTAHYRSQLNYSEENLNLAQGALERLYTALRGTDQSSGCFWRRTFCGEAVKQWMMILIRQMHFLFYLEARCVKLLVKNRRC